MTDPGLSGARSTSESLPRLRPADPEPNEALLGTVRRIMTTPVRDVLRRAKAGQPLNYHDSHLHTAAGEGICAREPMIRLPGGGASGLHIPHCGTLALCI
jgi:hypothetical protein